MHKSHFQTQQGWCFYIDAAEKQQYFTAGQLQSKLVLQTPVGVYGSNRGHAPVRKQQLLFRSHACKQGYNPCLSLVIMQSRDLRVSPLESHTSQNVSKKLITWPQYDLLLVPSNIFLGRKSQSCFMWSFHWTVEYEVHEKNSNFRWVISFDILQLRKKILERLLSNKDNGDIFCEW